MTDNVIPFRGAKPNGTSPDDPLFSLPTCPVTNCGKCGKSCEEAGGWISTRGCMTCMTPLEQELMNELSSASGRAEVFSEELEVLLVAARAAVKAPFPRVITELRRVVELIDDNERRVPLRPTSALSTTEKKT